MESDQDKPVIFISHAAADTEIATKFKSDVEESFLGLCRLFVSSNLESLQGGKEWLQEIKRNLSVAKISIGLISPIALSRPWIYTEFGAGWIRDIPTISVCHSGLNRSQLPAPLSHFQALDLTEETNLQHLYHQISKAIGCQCPNRDFSSDVKGYIRITDVHKTMRLFQHWISQLNSWNPDFKKLFNNESVEILVPGELDLAFKVFAHEAETRRYLKIDSLGLAMGTRLGVLASSWGIHPGEHFDAFKKFLFTDQKSSDEPTGDTK